MAVTRQAVAAFALLAVYLVVSAHVVRFVDTATADALADEGGIIEMFGAICLLIGAVFVLMAFLRLRTQRHTGLVEQVAYIGLVLFLVFAETNVQVLLGVAALCVFLGVGRRVDAADTPARRRDPTRAPTARAHADSDREAKFASGCMRARMSC